MKIIGLTGPSGTGKTTFGSVATACGYTVIDCDKTARKVIENPQIAKSIAAAFPTAFDSNRLDRKALAKAAFSTRENTEKLNQIILPAIKAALENEIAALKSKGVTHLLLDAPTLFESGLDQICTAVIALLASPKLCKQRITARDQLTPDQLADRLNAAQNDEYFSARTPYIIYNNGSMDELKKTATDLLLQLK